jgi:hypothetical protein
VNRLALTALCLAALAGVSACGQAPTSDFPQAGDPGPGPNLQRLSFTGVAEPASGRLQLVLSSQAIGKIPESADGNALTVAVNTVQVYGASVAFVSSNALYPAGCNPAAPQLMLAGVEVFSGFTEQLRNVYANLTATSSGPTACATNSLGSFAGAVGPSVGAWLYQPLNAPVTAASAIKRSVQWALNLPDNSPYWFTGDIWAEVIPMPPTNVLPADGAVYHRATPGTVTVPFSWTADLTANGTNPEGYVVARPSRSRVSLTILRCGSAAAPFNAADCTTTILAATRFTGSSTTQSLATGFWYQWAIRSAFRLPGTTAYSLGSTVITRTLSVVTP